MASSIIPFLIGFAVLYLIHHQEVQKKIQKELDDVCGNSLPSLAHRARYLKSACDMLNDKIILSV